MVGPGRLEAPALVDRDVDQHRTVPHPGHQLVGDQLGGLGPDDQHGADDDVGVDAGLLDGMGAGGHRLERAPEVVVDLAEALEVAVEDVDLGVHAHGQGGGGHAGHAGPEDDHLGAAHAGDTADQHPPRRLLGSSGGGRPSAGPSDRPPRSSG